MPSTTVQAAPETVPASGSSEGSGTSPWVWVLVGLGVVALVIASVLLVQRRRRQAAMKSWRAESRSAVDAARLSLGMIPQTPAEVDRQQLESIRGSVEQAADGLDRAASRAPTEEARSAARRASEALRGLFFSLEAGLILRESTTPATADQLMEADKQARTRRSEAQAAIDDLDRLVGEQPSKGS